MACSWSAVTMMQRVLVVGHLVGQRHRLGEGHPVGHGAVRVAGVVGVVHAAGLDLQVVALVVLRQVLDRGRGHVGERGLVLLGAVVLVLHVAVLEQREHGGLAREVEPLEGLGVPGVLRARAGGALDQVLAVGAQPFGALVGGRALGDEVAPPAAHGEVHRAGLHRVQELGGDVLLRGASLGHRVLPVAAGRLGVDGRGRRVGDARGRHDAHGLAHVRDDLGEGHERVALHGRAVLVGRGLREVDGVELLLDAGVHGARRRCRVGRLRVDVVGLDQRQIGELLEGQDVVVAHAARLLPGEEARGVVGSHPVAVRHHQDDVLGRPGDRPARELLLEHVLRVGEPLAVGLGQVLGEGGGRGERGDDGEPGGDHGIPVLLGPWAGIGFRRTMAPT